ncbi:hypothetical protein V2J09_016050 [Rumex salicifolius]
MTLPLWSWCIMRSSGGKHLHTRQVTSPSSLPIPTFQKRMEIAQEREWAEAQKVVLSVDMVSAAKRHLRFLAAVDQTGHLYDGPVLRKALRRYNVCWLPLLAKHTETPLCEDPLVVPLDCEWIWHCHRLNPVRYVSECKELFGRLLDSRHVVSSVEGYSKKKTEEIWGEMFPDEPYELDFTKAALEDAQMETLQGEKITDYDLVSAVERQSSFYWQVSRPHMSDDLFLQESVDRYKGFLYLMKMNMEKSAMYSCVPTYDIDLIWHTHQLHPSSYSKDLIQLLGMVLEHDDTDSDRSEGNTLNLSFKQTTQQWEDLFGRSYWRAGAMYKGSETPLLCDEQQKPIKGELMEVLVEFTGVKPIPEGVKQDDLYVSFKKKQPDMFFTSNEGINLGLQSAAGEKEVALFWCEPTGELLIELRSQNTLSSTLIGFASFSLNEILHPISELSVRKWIYLSPPTPQSPNCEPISLHIAVSFTVPIPATTQMLHMMGHETPHEGDGCIFEVAAGGCSVKCSGKCKGGPPSYVGGGGCSGKCSGKCKGGPPAVFGGGGCSGKCSEEALWRFLAVVAAVESVQVSVKEASRQFLVAEDVVESVLASVEEARLRWQLVAFDELEVRKSGDGDLTMGGDTDRYNYENEHRQMKT